MEETVYGLQVARGPALADSKVQLWKSWPGGMRCLVLELPTSGFKLGHSEDIPVRSDSRPPWLTPWKVNLAPEGRRCTFNPESDWWAASPDVLKVFMCVKPVKNASLETDIREAIPRVLA